MQLSFTITEREIRLIQAWQRFAVGTGYACESLPPIHLERPFKRISPVAASRQAHVYERRRRQQENAGQRRATPRMTPAGALAV